jgi:hypothetical protein
MNSQDILRNLGLGFDIVLDNSETYDYELAAFDNDYNSQVINFTKPISYEIPITKSLSGHNPNRDTIMLCEVDNRINDPNYIYSGITYIFDFSEFAEHFNIVDDSGVILHSYENFQLNNDVYTYTGFTGETHYFKICAFNVYPTPTPTPTDTPVPTSTETPLPTSTEVPPTPTATEVPPTPTNTPTPTPTVTFPIIQFFQVNNNANDLSVIRVEGPANTFGTSTAWGDIYELQFNRQVVLGPNTENVYGIIPYNAGVIDLESLWQSLTTSSTIELVGMPSNPYNPSAGYNSTGNSVKIQLTSAPSYNGSIATIRNFTIVESNGFGLEMGRVYQFIVTV